MKLKELFSRLVKPRRPLEYLLFTLIVAGVVSLDQLTKLYATVFLKKLDTLPILDGVLHLTYVENRGAAFGILKDAPWVFNTFSVIAIIFLIGFVYLGHSETKLYTVSCLMIAGGGIGNMIDRVSVGFVVDFIDFRLIDFAVFNIADSFVCVGAGLLILALFLEIKKEIQKSDVGDAPGGAEE